VTSFAEFVLMMMKMQDIIRLVNIFQEKCLADARPQFKEEVKKEGDMLLQTIQHQMKYDKVLFEKPKSAFSQLVSRVGVSKVEGGRNRSIRGCLLGSYHFAINMTELHTMNQKPVYERRDLVEQEVGTLSPVLVRAHERWKPKSNSV
jgi:hypothetical protein